MRKSSLLPLRIILAVVLDTPLSVAISLSVKRFRFGFTIFSKRRLLSLKPNSASLLALIVIIRLEFESAELERFERSADEKFLTD